MDEATVNANSEETDVVVQQTFSKFNRSTGLSPLTPITYTDISLAQLEAMTGRPDTVVVDVREPWEYEEFNIGGINIPLADIRERREELLPFQQVIVVCTNGTRSRVAAKDYCRAEAFQHKQLYHLQGGLLEVED